MTGYEINLDHVCRTQKFKPNQVVTAELVYPKGAVPNAQLLWIKIELDSGEKMFVTVPLREFHSYVTLPASSLGGWTDGEKGTELSGLQARYQMVHSDGAMAVEKEGQT